MRDPYRARADYARYGVAALAVASLVLVALVLFYLFRPNETAAEQRAGDALTAQMDAAQKANDGRVAARRADQVREMQ